MPKTWYISESHAKMFLFFLNFWLSIQQWAYSDFTPLFFCSPSDGYHTDLVCQPACCYWCHLFCCCSGPFKIYGNQQGCCIYLFSMTPSTINCNFSFSGGLTLTPRRGMGIRALTDVSNWYCLLAVFTTVLLHTLTAGTSVDGRENV